MILFAIALIFLFKIIISHLRERGEEEGEYSEELEEQKEAIKKSLK